LRSYNNINVFYKG